MRKLAVLLGFVLCVAASPSAFAQSPQLCDTLDAQYLFVDGDRVYLRVFEPIGPRDSLWVPGLGTVVEADPPIVKLAVSTYFVHLQMGATVRILRTVLRRRAADVYLDCDPAVWDPLTIESGSAFAAAGLFHRGLFRLTDDQGGVEGDLARDWFWKGFDLFVIIDTTARFGDGTQVDASTVKSSIERYLWYRRDVPEYSWQYSIVGIKAYRTGRTDQVLGIIPRSRDTLQFNMERPLYDLPAYLATPALFIVRWQREAGAAPVVATAGHYGLRTADTVWGRAPSFGRIVLKETQGTGDEVQMLIEDDGTEGTADSVRDVPAPGLLVVRPLTSSGRQLLTFMRFAVDREAVRAAAGVPGARDATSMFPQADGSPSTAQPDIEKAREARRLVRGSSRARIGWLGSERAVANYLVDALKAWDLGAVLADSNDAADIRVERWAFDEFLPCAIAEQVLLKLGHTPEDSLVALLQRARQMQDDGERRQAYRSLLVRIADDSPYLALLQLGVQIRARENCEYKYDRLGRPAGPIFAPGEEP